MKHPAPDIEVTLDEAAKELDVEVSEVSSWVDAGHITPDAKGKFKLTDVFRHAITRDIQTLFGPKKGPKWLTSPNGLLGSRTPKELLGTPDETLVFDIIEHLKYGGGQ